MSRECDGFVRGLDRRLPGRMVGLVSLWILAWVECAPALGFPAPDLVDVFGAQVRRRVTAKVLFEVLSDAQARELHDDALVAAKEFGPDAKELVPLLITALDRERGVTRCHAASVIGNIGPATETAVPALIKALGDDEPGVRSAAAEALGGIGPASHPATTELAAILSRAAPGADGYFSPAREAAITLGKIGAEARSAAPILLATLQKSELSPYLREAAATALGRVAAPGDPAVISALFSVAKLGSGHVALGAGDTGANQEAAVRIAAALAAWKKSHDRRVVGWLAQTLRHKSNDSYLRKRATDALGEIGPEAAAAVPTLISVVAEHDHCSRAAAAALGRIGVNAKAAVPFLVERLGRRSWLSKEAAEALGQIGAPAKPALNALALALASLEKREYQARIAAAEAIRQLGGDIEPTVPALVDCLGVKQIEYGDFSRFPGARQAARIRARAARALGDLGRSAAEATPALESLLDDEFVTVREAAAEALQSIKRESDS